MTTDSRFAEIDRLKAQLDSLRPLPPHTVRTLHEQQYAFSPPPAHQACPQGKL
jgi:hypothetical protein